MTWRRERLNLREELVALCVPDGASREPRAVTVQVHLVGRGATDAFWRIVTRQSAVKSVREFPDFISASWGDDLEAVGFSLYARDSSQPSLDTRVVVSTDGGELP